MHVPNKLALADNSSGCVCTIKLTLPGGLGFNTRGRIIIRARAAFDWHCIRLPRHVVLLFFQDAENGLQYLIDLFGNLLSNFGKGVLDFSFELLGDWRISGLVALFVRVRDHSCHANVVEVRVLTVNLQQSNNRFSNNRLITVSTPL